MKLIKNYRDILLTAIEKCCDEKQFSWLSDVVATYSDKAENPVDDLVTNIARARRRVGRQLIGQHLQTIETNAGLLPVAHWQTGDAARVVLLLNALLNTSQQDSQENNELLTTIFKMGSDAEQTAIVSALCLYADDNRYLEIALEAGRTNSLELFNTVAINTPYPSQYYDQSAFNQLVLKSLFVGVNIDGILNLNKRFNQELSRMCEDYYDERVAANRSVPADIWLALAPYASTRGETLLKDALTHSDEKHRDYAMRALSKKTKQYETER